MKNKMRNVEYYLLIFATIVGIYIIILHNFEKFTLDYQGQILTYDNKYKIEDKENRIRQYLAKSETNISVSKEEEKQIQENKIIQNLCQYNSTKNEQTKITYKEEIAETDNAYIVPNQTVIKDTKYGDILYIYGQLYEIAFTKDMKNVYYIRYQIYDTNRIIEKNKSIEIIQEIPTEIEQTKEEIIQKIEEQLKEIGILKTKLIPDSILIERDRQINNYKYNYVIEDKVNNIKVNYNINTGKVHKIIIGFD